MKIKTADLIGRPLSYAVAICEGYTDLRKNSHVFNDELIMTPPRAEYGAVTLAELAISWDRCGPILEREGITLRTNVSAPGQWAAFIDFGSSNTNVKARQSGPTPLVAAMRCFVSSKLGDEIEIPEELL